MLTQKSNITLVYDSTCLMCNSFIIYIYKNDYNNLIKFTSFTSNYCKLNNISPNMNSILFLIDNKVYFKSEAILEVFELLKLNSLIRTYLKYTPKFINNIIYDIIAKYRHLIKFNPKTCSISIQKHILR